MSFSLEIKTELTKIEIKNTCCATAELAGITCFSASINNNQALSISTENIAVVRRIDMLAKKLDIIIDSVSEKLSGNNTVWIKDQQSLLKLLKISGLEHNDIKKFIAFRIISAIVRKNCCKKSFLRGAFLTAGSVSQPEKSYHFEIATHHYPLSRDLCALMNNMKFSPKTVRRKSNYIIYFKDSNRIADIITVMGAHRCLLDFENVRVFKEVRNNVNRVVNCETGNLQKTVVAASNQIMDIEYIKKNIGFEALPDNLREIAELRLKHRESSLKELSEMLSIKISKSGVNHRLKKLECIAENLRKNAEV